MQSAACVLVDGTFWTDDEMIRLGVSTKRARDIGHLPQSGPGGMLEWLDRLPPATRRILIHINNTNPILNEASAESAELVAPRRRGGVGRHGDRAVSGAAWSREEFEAQLRAQGRAYHIHHPFNRLLNSGAATPRADPRLGGESLLLSDQHSDQGCGHSLQLHRPRRAPLLGAAHSGSRRLRRGPRRNRILAAAGGGGGTVPRDGGEPQRSAAGRALRGGCLCQFRAPRAVAGGGVLLAHRAVRAGDPQAAARQLAGALSVDRPRRGCIISRAA